MSVLVKVIQSPANLDGSNLKQFTHEIESLMETGVKIVLLDLKNVTFMSSSGLMALVNIRKLVKAAGCQLVISSRSEPVRMLLEITGAEQLFEIFPSGEEINSTGGYNFL